MAKYVWYAYCEDGAYEANSDREFSTRKAAYEDMREEVLDKMKWNTEYDEDFNDGEPVIYEVEFRQDRIIHTSFSGRYVYQIKKQEE